MILDSSSSDISVIKLSVIKKNLKHDYSTFIVAVIHR